MPEEILLMDNITKVYANGFVANKDVTLSVNKGEIHALCGENGAGKSTLMKVLFGSETPEEGRIVIKGEEVKIKNPLEAIALGVGMVWQHFMLCPSLTIAENLILGMEPKKFGKFGPLNMAQANKVAQEACEKYGFKLDVTRKVEELAVGNKQKVEILKALIRGAEILILDEPTAVLTPQETAELFVQLRHLKELGHTIIFISHHLDEVKELCDRLTVLRLGKSVGTAIVADVTQQDISRMMVGRDVMLKIDKTKAQPAETVLKIRDLTYKDEEGRDIVKGFSASVRKGEIIGIAGVEGNGQREISEIITGLLPLNNGEITIDGQSIRGKSIRQIREMGVAHISEDRMTYGCSENLSVKDNIISDRYYKKDYKQGPLMNNKKLDTEVDELIKEFLVKCGDRNEPVRMLSGGNMQKVVVAREFSGETRLIVANQPTRGIDVGATEFIRRKLVELRDNGAAVLLITADLNEALELSDSLVVMCGGEIVAYFEDASQVTDFILGEYMLGLKRMSDEEIGRVCYD